MYRSQCFFLDSPGETGKAYIINAKQNCLKFWRKNVIAVAAFAVAAKLLKNGRTDNATFKISVPCSVEDMCFAFVNLDEARSLRPVLLIIYDERVTCHCHFIEAMDSTLQYIMQKSRSFDGKVLLFTGDFRKSIL